MFYFVIFWRETDKHKQNDNSFALLFECATKQLTICTAHIDQCRDRYLGGGVVTHYIIINSADIKTRSFLK